MQKQRAGESLGPQPGLSRELLHPQLPPAWRGARCGSSESGLPPGVPAAERDHKGEAAQDARESFLTDPEAQARRDVVGIVFVGHTVKLQGGWGWWPGGRRGWGGMGGWTW